MLRRAVSVNEEKQVFEVEAAAFYTRRCVMRNVGAVNEETPLCLPE